MIEIFFLIYLCSQNSKLAALKNLSKRKWIIRTILNWILGEITGLILLMSVLNVDAQKLQENKEFSVELLYLMTVGICGGYLGYLFTRKRLEATPDGIE
jgi:hypothetical protein